MSFRWLALVAALLLGFGGGYLVARSAGANPVPGRDLVIRDGPIIHLENRSKKDQYVIVTVPKPGVESAVVINRQGTAEIRKSDLKYLAVYPSKSGIDLGRYIKPCQCSLPLPPPPPPQLAGVILTNQE